MRRELVCVLTTALVLQIIGASTLMCPSDPNCVCGGTLAVELNCNIDGRIVKINLLPNTYINIKCENTTKLDYNKLPKCANQNMNTFKSVSFKDCPLPSSSFKDVLTNMGVSKTMALIFQNAKNLSGYFDRKHFAGLQDLTKLLLSINGITRLPDNLFADINKLTWLNIRSNSISLSEELFKPLERLETLEISHNHMTNISSNLFSHLTLLRKLSLWQSNITWFSEDLFTGVDVLEELDLSSNGLNELPWSIFKPLKKLKKLTLFSNKFSSLPQNLFKYNDELETVVILNNDVKLKELPKYLFGNLENLKQVYIQRCGLEFLPYDVFANSSHITNISLAYNDIKSLPESIFNDQIDLLELDLSHNKLYKLEPKIFSSLVRLETLNLCYNSLMEISGPVFSSLLSLIYLNMEHNNLKTISTYLFSNNKQKMSISLAYNQLDFEIEELSNNLWVVKRTSPFAHTFNLRLLNLSHNQFQVVFNDWLSNGHDILDISHNSIKLLWDEKPLLVKGFIKKPLKEMWIANNPLQCVCRNFHFIDFVEELKTKVPDSSNFKCSTWEKETCYTRFIVIVAIVVVVLWLNLVILGLLVINRIKFHNKILQKILEIKMKDNPHAHEILENVKKYGSLKDIAHKDTAHEGGDNITRNIIIKYCDDDEEFILKEVVPEFRCHNFKLLMQSVNNTNNKQKFLKSLTQCVRDASRYTTVVIFSPNYLMSAYSHVNIKKIQGEILKAEKTVYVFIDIGSDNSIYAFLKQQRDEGTSVLWSEVDFWNKILSMLTGDHRKTVGAISKKVDSRTPSKKFKTAKAKLPANVSFSKLPDWSPLYNVNTFSHSHV